ncbi:MAG: hypothetical protein I8H75_01120 [Myxococcaceae bacterium]|nr:hypothetical protein [Myxococcaceae bacterium]
MESLNPKSFCIYFLIVALLTLMEEKSDSLRNRVTMNCLSFCVPYGRSICSAACLGAYSLDRSIAMASRYVKEAAKDNRLALIARIAQ